MNLTQHAAFLPDVEAYYANGDIDIVIDGILQKIHQPIEKPQVVLIQGLAELHRTHTQSINKKIAMALDAEIILVVSPENKVQHDLMEIVIAPFIFSPHKEKPLVTACSH